MIELKLWGNGQARVGNQGDLVTTLEATFSITLPKPFVIV